MAKEKFKTAAVEEIGNITLYAISDNYHDRRKTPGGIFADYDRAEEHIKQIIEKHEENKDKNSCLFPTFTNKTILEFKIWYNKLTKYNINIPSPTYIKIDENDPLYDEDKKDMIIKQNIKPNTTLSKINEIVITYIEK